MFTAAWSARNKTGAEFAHKIQARHGRLPVPPAAAPAVSLMASTPAPTAGTSSPAAHIGARRTRFIDGQPAALQRLPVQPGNGALHVFAIRQLNKSKAPRLPRGSVANDHSRGCLKPRTAHELVEFVVCNLVGQIPHEQLLRHGMLPVARRSHSPAFAR